MSKEDHCIIKVIEKEQGREFFPGLVLFIKIIGLKMQAAHCMKIKNTAISCFKNLEYNPSADPSLGEFRSEPEEGSVDGASLFIRFAILPLLC